MSVQEQLKSLKHIRCNFGGHKVSLDQEERLYDSGNTYLETECERCHVPLLLKIDPKDSRYFLVTEK